MMVRLISDGREIELEGTHWREVIPVSLLPSRLKFYRALRDRANGAYSAHYRETVEGLERVSKELGAPLTPHPNGGGRAA